MGKEYSIYCPENEQAGLLEAATMLRSNLEEMRKNSHAGNWEDLAVVSGLNMAHEAIKNRNANAGRQSALAERMQRIGHKIEESMKTVSSGKFE